MNIQVHYEPTESFRLEGGYFGCIHPEVDVQMYQERGKAKEYGVWCYACENKDMTQDDIELIIKGDE